MKLLAAIVLVIGVVGCGDPTSAPKQIAGDSVYTLVSVNEKAPNLTLIPDPFGAFDLTRDVIILRSDSTYVDNYTYDYHFSPQYDNGKTVTGVVDSLYGTYERGPGYLHFYSTDGQSYVYALNDNGHEIEDVAVDLVLIWRNDR